MTLYIIVLVLGALVGAYITANNPWLGQKLKLWGNKAVDAAEKKIEDLKS